MSSTTTLDLEGTVTREQYEAAVISLCATFNTVAEEMGWCGERHRYFAAIIPEYDYDREDGESRVNFSLVPDDEDYAARIKGMRARILWYGRAGTIRMSIVNRGLNALGLPDYEGSKSGARFRVYLTLELNVTAHPDTTGRRWLYDHLREVLPAAMDGKPVEDNRYVPGSAAVSNVDVNALTGDEGEISAADTEVPSYR
jgi:hypothetical protein